ncbi:SDR family oxidoreductase [Mycolicibacterium sp. XJ870]
MRMTGNHVLVTGGGSGIGRGIAESLHRLGNHVTVAGRRETALKEVARANSGMQYLVLDQTDPADIARFAAALAALRPELNVLINNAGIQRPEDLTTGDVQAAVTQIATNLLGPIRLTAALLPGLASQPSAAIINVTSGLAFVPNAAMPTYSATKAALHSYTQSLRHQLRDTAIEVIEIIPPQVRTALRDTDDPRAMPLEDYIAETMTLLTAGGLTEITVARVAPLRQAEHDHTYDELFGAMNPPRPAPRGPASTVQRRPDGRGRR